MQKNSTEKLFFGIVFMCTVLAMVYLYQSFWMDFGIAVLICVATIGLKRRVLKFIPSNFFASLISVFILILVFIFPIFFLAKEIMEFFSNFTREQLMGYLEASKEGIFNIVTKFPIPEKLASDILQNLYSLENNFSEFGMGSSQDFINFGIKISSFIAKEGLSFLVHIGFIILFLFVLFFYSRFFYKAFLRFMPFSIRQGQEIYEEVSSVLKIVLFASVINVIFQGIAFGVFVWILDYKNSLLLGVLYGLSSLIPVVGGLVVWLPVVGYELHAGNYYQAMVIAIYSILFIALFIDNIVRPFVIGVLNRNMLDKPLKVNELVIFFSIFAGFTSFGFWGIVIGPGITAFFIAVFRLIHNNKLNF